MSYFLWPIVQGPGRRMNRAMTTVENAAAPRHRYPTPGNPLAANNMPPRAAPQTPPDWLLAPNSPTLVARDWLDTSALKVISTGQETLKSKTAATAAQTGTSIENSLSFRLATGPPM